LNNIITALASEARTLVCKSVSGINNRLAVEPWLNTMWDITIYGALARSNITAKHHLLSIDLHTNLEDHQPFPSKNNVIKHT